MKKVLFTALAALLVSVPASHAQIRVDKNGLLKKIEKSEADIQKRGDRAATWITRGDVFFDAATEVSKNLYTNMDAMTAGLLFGQPSASEAVTLNTVPYTKETYPFFEAYKDSQTGNIVTWDIKEIIYPDALMISARAYSKAYEMDSSSAGNVKKVREGLKKVYDALYSDGGIRFSIQQYETAAHDFENAYAVSQLPGAMIDDSSVAALLRDAGLAYYWMKDYQKSLDNYHLALDKGYEDDGEVYYLLYHDYKSLDNGDKESIRKGKAVLEEGIKRYPSNVKIIESLTDAYVTLEENPAGVLPLIEAAIDADPSNPALYSGLGIAYDRMGDKDKAIEAFANVARLLPGDFNANNNLGILYMTKGTGILEELNNNYSKYASQAEWDAEAAKAYDSYQQAIPHFEKALEINPQSVGTVDFLRNIAFRLRDEREGMTELHKKYDDMFKQLSGQQ